MTLILSISFMNKIKLFQVAFIFIVCLAFFLRIYNLQTIPPGVNRDEAAIGYNAYSLLLTGKDEYGKFLPISLQSFGDWKLPVYIYETILTIKLFGLNEFAIRLPSALAGTISVILAFFIVKQLFTDRKLAMVTMLLMAISPWSLHLSRTTSEANMAVCLISAGVLIFLKQINKKSWLLLLTGILFALTFGTYAGNYVFTTLLSLGLFFLYRKELLRHRFGIATIITFIALSSFLWLQTAGANVTKISGIGIFGDPSIVNARIVTPRNEHANPQSILVKLLNNKINFGAEQFAQNYVRAFSPEFLFIHGGGNHAHNILNFGNMYLVEAPFFFLGLALLFVQKRGRSYYLVLLWLLIAPLAPSLTKDAPHTVRMFAIFPILPLVTALGLLWLVKIVPKIFYLPVIGIIFVLFALNIGTYLDRYYVLFPYEESQNWGILYKKINTIISQNEFANRKVIMSEPNTSPYIYLLFYGAYDPKNYQNEAIRYPITEDGFLHVKGFGRFTFRTVAFEEDLKQPNTLLIVRSDTVEAAIRNQYKTVDIALPSGAPWFTIIQTNP